MEKEQLDRGIEIANRIGKLQKVRKDIVEEERGNPRISNGYNGSYYDLKEFLEGESEIELVRMTISNLIDKELKKLEKEFKKL